MKLRIEIINKNFKDMSKVEALAADAFDFPPKVMAQMSEEEDMDFLAFYDDDIFVGFIVVSQHKNMIYVFFFAIDQTLRSSGYGARALSTLKEHYKGCQFFADIEKIDVTAPDNEERKRRRAFYLRNGYKTSEYFMFYKETDYEVLYSEGEFDLDSFKELIANTLDGKFQEENRTPINIFNKVD